MLLGPPILLQQPQPAIPPNAVRHMHDQIAFAQLQETIDRPRLPPPRRPRQILPLKQLARTHQHHLLRHNPKPSLQMPDDKMQPGSVPIRPDDCPLVLL